MANPFFSNATRYPLTIKPLTSPDVKQTHTDIFNIQNTLRSLLRDMDTLFLGHHLGTSPPQDAAWVDVGTGGTASQDSTEQLIVASGASTGTNLIIRARALQATPYKFTALIHSQFPQKANLGAGICVRDSVSGAFTTLGVRGANLEVTSYTSETVLGSVLTTVPFIPSLPQWYRIQDDGTNMIFQYSGDGDYWITLHSIAHIAYNQAGFWCSNENSATPNLGIVVRCFSWRVEAP